MPSIGKFVIGNISTLQSASNIYVDPANYKYVHASSSNVELAIKNIDDKLEELIDSSITTSGNNTFTGTNSFSGDLTASQGLSLSGGSLIMSKSRLGTDGNAGATGDSIMLFDASDSDLAKTITISQLSTLVDTGGDSADYYAALTASNTFTGVNTFSGEITASQGILIADVKKIFFGTGKDASIEYDEDGTDELRFNGAAVTFGQSVSFDGDVTIGLGGATNTLTIPAKITASHGIHISDGAFVANKDILDADGNAGATGDSIMVFDASDSDLAKRITITQLSSLITVENDNADYYAALTGSNTFTNTNTFAGDLTASQGMTSMGNISVNGTLSANTVSSMGSITASNGLTVMGTDDGASLAILTANTGSFYVSTKGAVSISSQNEDQAAFPISLGNSTSVGGNLTTTGAITSSNGLVVTSPDSSKGVAESFNVSHDGTVTIGVDSLAVNMIGSTSFFGDITASQGMKIITNDTSTTPAFEVYNQGTGDAALMWSISGDSFAMGIDNNASDRLKISYAGSAQGATLGTNDLVTINSSGYVGIGDNTPDVPLDVEGTIGNFLAAFRNDGDSSSNKGIKVQCGQDSGAGTLLGFYDGDGTSLGDVTFSGGTVSYGTFTGDHLVAIPSASNESGYDYGTILKIQSVSYPTGFKVVYYDCAPTTSSNDAAVLGVYNTKMEHSDWNNGSDNVHSVFSLGDGHILVCNEGGDISVGDYIASSDTSGHGKKQSDDLLHNYTVAKATEAVVWADEAGTTKLIACTYHCG